jgi:pyrroloquinoline quinone (PQQ) biosynthesis protein C
MDMTRNLTGGMLTASDLRALVDNAPKCGAGRSNLHGWGLFAREPIADGEVIIDFSSSELYREAPADELEDWRLRGGKFTALSETACLISDRLTKYSLLNHSERPNAVVDTAARCVIAAREIAVGEEVTVDYRREPVPLPARPYFADWLHDDVSAQVATDLTEGIARLRIAILEHQGMQALEEFGTNLATMPLSQADLRLFLATTAAFFREVPTGILALGLRVADDWRARERFTAVSKAANVLYSAVDEFGLHDLNQGVVETHHELFLAMSERWGISATDLDDPRLILPEGKALGQLTAEFYRHRPIAEALGFHFASEVTSEREFILCFHGLVRFCGAYGLTGPEDPTLNFYRIHTAVEPMHGATSLAAICSYEAVDPAILHGVTGGAMAFMRGYGALFAALNRRCFALAPACASAMEAGR